jgi:hypothetical protein
MIDKFFIGAGPRPSLAAHHEDEVDREEQKG